MAILFPLGIPLYCVLALYKVRVAINTPLPSILKDTDHITAFALAGHKLKDMSEKKLSSARKHVHHIRSFAFERQLHRAGLDVRNGGEGKGWPSIQSHRLHFQQLGCTKRRSAVFQTEGRFVRPS
jgi:hypothetical protein